MIGGMNVIKPKEKRPALMLKERFNKSSIHSNKPSPTPKNEVINAKVEKIFTAFAIILLWVMVKVAVTKPFNVASCCKICRNSFCVSKPWVESCHKM